MTNLLQKFEKVNKCGVVTENYCRKRCRYNKDYPACDTPVQKKKVEAAKAWIEQRCWKRKTINWTRSSYGLKHDMEHETGIYVTNGDFIRAAILLGYNVIIQDYPNCFFDMGLKTERNKRYWDSQKQG